MDASDWIAIIALAVSLVGGVPGIIEILREKRAPARMSFTLGHLVSGQMGNGTLGLLLTGTLSNSGSTPLTPAFFDLDCRIDGVWQHFDRHLIPADLAFDAGMELRGCASIGE